jgi:transcriptional regulator with XRE-family HTH domain
MDQRAIGGRVKEKRLELEMSQEELAKLSGLTQSTISSLERGTSKTSGNIATLANALNVNALWLQTGRGDPKISNKARVLIDSGEQTTFAIDVMESRGTCGGGGRPDVDEIARTVGPIIKDQAFFARFGVEPSDMFALIADGDGMASFIVHGDTILFSTATNADRIESGRIYAFQTPDGPRVRRVLRRADGTVILAYDNPDKIRYPDEIYSPEQANQLDRLGAFIYRQG